MNSWWTREATELSQDLTKFVLGNTGLNKGPKLDGKVYQWFVGVNHTSDIPGRGPGGDAWTSHR